AARFRDGTPFYYRAFGYSHRTGFDSSHAPKGGQALNKLLSKAWKQYLSVCFQWYQSEGLTMSKLIKMPSTEFEVKCKGLFEYVKNNMDFTVEVSEDELEDKSVRNTGLFNIVML
ncbi:hypothetical protein LTS18_001141, partial [Coniosporium uncinatum]